MILLIKHYFKALYIRFKGRPGALKKAIRRADRKCRVYKLRYRVYFLDGKYKSLCRMEVQRKKHSGEWSRNVNVTKMESMCYYDTLLGIQPAGTEVLTAKS